MKTARFWTRAQGGFVDVPVTARGWSNESLEAARLQALDVARRVGERIAGGFLKSQRYPYGDRPLPEPVLREFSGAIVTRNCYGALVLNTETLMFVDVDRKQQPKQSGGGLFSSLFGRKQSEEPPPPDPEIAAMRAVAGRHDLSARLYETAAGYRLIVTSAPFHAGTPEAEALLAEFRADPLYVRLCRMQESFRARLTPKPFRIQCSNPPGEFPFETPEDRARHDRWVEKYNARSERFSTCRYMESFGRNTVLPEFAELLQYHDQETRSKQTLALA